LAKLNKAVFLDRDGTICEEVNYLTNPAQLKILPRVGEAIKLLNESGFKVIVVTNQSAIARGFMTEEDLKMIHKKMLRELSKEKAYIDAVYYCPHHPGDNCECRKPRAALLMKAVNELGVSLHDSYVVGDKQSDIALSSHIKCKSVLVLTGYGSNELQTIEQWIVKPTHIAADLYDAVRWILRKETAHRSSHDKITRSKE
jgi:histidinol-phosphate phosphatase family protein